MLTKVHTPAFGAARSVLAMATLLTLAFGNAHTLFWHNGLNELRTPLSWLGIFSLMGDHIELARWLAMAILALVVVGWKRSVSTGLTHRVTQVL